MKDSLRIIDLPNSNSQLHIHGDSSMTTLKNSRLYDYSRENYRTLNSYESAMADLYAHQLGLKTIDK